MEAESKHAVVQKASTTSGKEEKSEPKESKKEEVAIEKVVKKRKRATKAKNDSDESPEPTTKKKPAKPRAPRSLPGVSKEQFEQLKLPPLKKKLNQYVRSVAQMVDADWHDGYEEQQMECDNYFGELSPPIQAVYDIAIKKSLAFDQCHEILKLIADTWTNMLTIPSRGDIHEYYSEGSKIEIELDTGYEKEFGTIEGALGYMWKRLLCAAAVAQVPDEKMLRFIKDAFDNEPEFMDGEEENSDEDEDKEVSGEGGDAKSGVDKALEKGMPRLKALYEKGDWKQLPTTKKVHRQRRGIDRRFDGPKHRRTRDFSDDEDNENCLIM